MEYLSDSDLKKMQEIRDGVIRKIVGQRPAEEFERSLLEAHTPMLQMEISSKFNRHGVFAIPYLDTDDVLAWGTFLASRLEQTVIGVRDGPVFFMRANSR